MCISFAGLNINSLLFFKPAQTISIYFLTSYILSILEIDKTINYNISVLICLKTKNQGGVPFLLEAKNDHKSRFLMMTREQ